MKRVKGFDLMLDEPGGWGGGGRVMYLPNNLYHVQIDAAFLL